MLRVSACVGASSAHASEVPRSVRVLVVDDHDLFRMGLRDLLEDEGFEVADAVSGEAAIRRLPGFRPDVVVMDVNMPGLSGIEAAQRVTETMPGVAVLMLSVAGEIESVLDAIRAGASGYLLKDASLEDIVEGIRLAATGHSALAPRVASRLVTEVRATDRRRSPTRPAVPEHFSDRERDVLRLLAGGHDNRAIAERLYLSPSTVKNHVSHLLEKLGVDNRVQAAAYAIRHGLVDEEASA